MLGLLLARAGVEVIVLEKHADFLRDFRGDTIHPSTLEVMHELGLLEELLQRPHYKARQVIARMGDADFSIDLRHVPARCRFVMFMPQWEFLNFLTEHAKRYDTFTLLMRTEFTRLIEEKERVCGLRAISPDGPVEIRADLVIGADGRHSDVREQAGFKTDELGAAMDVVWFRLPREAQDPEDPQARFSGGGIFIMLNQGTHWQCGFVIGKGLFEPIQAQGLPAFKARIAELAPLVKDRLGAISDWEPFKLLTVRVDRLRQWYRDGVLCIGDAAHAMSPVGGVGINLAIQDAVATANLLARPLRERRLATSDLARVQARREWPARVTQRLQMAMQNRVIAPIVSGAEFKPPVAFRLMSRFPLLSRIPGRLVGIGVRPEHVEAPPVAAPSQRE